MTYQTITSPTNPLIKKIVRLHTSAERKRLGLCIIEGQRALSTALQKVALERLYCTESMLSHAHNLAQTHQITVVSNGVMKKISTAASPSGLLGIIPIPKNPSKALLTPGLVLAEITDPGNMGTLLRTAVAFNIHSVVVIGGCDPWSPKVIQATAGTSVHLKIFNWEWETLISSKKDLKLYALVVKGGKNTKTIDADKALLVIGNEARGLQESWLQQCDTLITLPMPGNAESLNAAVAGSIAAYLTFVS